MANPKRRHSVSRKGKRRTHQKLRVPQLIRCPQCKQAKLPHVVCGKCGYYKGRTAESIEEEEK